MPTRLERSTTDRMITGVCGGIAAYLQIEVTWVRLAFAVLGIFGGVGIIAYIILVILMPMPGQRAIGIAPAADGTDATEAHAATTGAAAPPIDTERRRQFAGYALIAIGVIFLLNNQGLFRFLEWRTIWPLALVVIGALLLAQRFRR